MSDSDSDDIYNFRSDVNFEAQQDEKETELSNNHHFKVLSEICDTFYENLQKHDDFNHKTSWRSYSGIEPIKIKIETEETLPGICDIIKPNGNFFHKIMITFSTIIYEIENLLPFNGFSIFESLFPISVYGEKIFEEGKDEVKEIFSGEEQISRMLPTLSEIYEKLTACISISINLLNQLINLYSDKNNKNYNTSYKFISFESPFDYLGKLISYFLAIDTVVKGNEFLSGDWNAYRTLIYQNKNNMGQYNISDDQKKKLEKLIKKISTPIMDSSCFKQCLNIIIAKTGLIDPNGTTFINKPYGCQLFYEHFTKYLKKKYESIYTEIGTFTENSQKIDLFYFLALFGLYMKLYESKADKNLIKNVWLIQKKLDEINLVGISFFDIQSYLLSFKSFMEYSGDSQNLKKKIHANLVNIEKTFSYLINNLRLNVMTWITKVESDIFDIKTYLGPNEKTQINYLIDKSNKRINLITNGLHIANYIRKHIKFILEKHLQFGASISYEINADMTTGFELLKVIESEYERLMPIIAINLNAMNRALLSPMQCELKKIAEKVQRKVKEGKSTNEQLYKDVLSASTTFYICSQATPSRMRRIIEKLCIEVINSKDILEPNQIFLFSKNFAKLEILNQLSKEVAHACDCSFFYYYQIILPKCLETIYKDKPLRLYYFAQAVNDMEKPLMYLRFAENNGMNYIKILRKNIQSIFEANFLKKLSIEIEIDLRKQVHSVFIEGLKPPEYSEIQLANYLKIKKFRLFDVIFDVKRYVEEYLNTTFYKMTTLNLNDWQTYQQMRVLAKNKYNLNLHEVFLPSQNLEQGKDILDIIRNLKTFTKGYTHNIHSQVFIEIGKNTAYINNIGVTQILNSLYTHGTGIINSVVNKAFNFISQLIKPQIELIFDDYILSMLKDERIFWNENKAKINYNYPLERGQNLRNKILNYSDDKKTNLIIRSIQLITQIGNAVGLSRCIQTAMMDYNSQNVKLLNSGNVNDFNQLTKDLCLQIDQDPALANENISNISSNLLSNIQNSLNDANNMFCNTISALKQTGENSTNYLQILVSSFGDILSPSKIPDIDLFAFLLPPLIITYIDNCINAKDNLVKKNKNEESAYFSDDGFIMGMCYLLKLFKADSKFESLNWFPSVIAYYANKKNKKNTISDEEISTLNERQIESYKTEFEMQYFTYSSASILFCE